ncbi:MAG: helix-turn-helix transcriptional regulator [Clostridia bacterium]|nr:helix-turn-helix transcriptional regulator [Clostridia bacterium]
MANRIRELRERRRMSQVRLSIELEVSQETVSAYESGKHYPSYAVLVKLSDLFGVSIDYLMGREQHRSGWEELNAEEKALLGFYRSLDPVRRAKAEAYLEGLSDGEPK